MEKKRANQEDIDIIGQWSVEKLSLLQKYLEAYVTVLSKQPWCKGYEYIDAFAGAGKAKTKEEQAYISGSPRIALELKKPFSQYHFVEQSDWRVSQLEELRVEFKGRNISIYQADCNKILKEKILPQLDLKTYKRAIAFIDPYGTEIEQLNNVMQGYPGLLYEMLYVLRQVTQRIELKATVPLLEEGWESTLSALNRIMNRIRKKMDLPLLHYTLHRTSRRQKSSPMIIHESRKQQRRKNNVLFE